MVKTQAAEEDDRTGVGVITRAAAVLRALAETTSGMSLGQISARTGLARSTVQRLVLALQTEGFVSTGLGAGQIILGSELMRLAARARPGFIARIRPLMEELSAELSETVDLSIVRKNELVFLDQILGSQRLVAVSHVGDVFPLHCTSVGKARLAMMTPEEIRRSIGSQYPVLTPRTLRDLPSLLEALEPIRRTQVGVDSGEHTEGICAIGVIVPGDGGELYGLSIPVPSARFDRVKDRAVELLLQARSDATAQSAAS